LTNISALSKRHLILTVPKGNIFPIDRSMGHVRHFNYQLLSTELQKSGFNIKYYVEWGFPFHTIYKHLINIFPGYFCAEFANKPYSSTKIIFSKLLEGLFYANFYFWGYQIVLWAEKKNS
jgi:hypothetical protein